MEHGKLVSAEGYRAFYDPLAGFEGVCSLARQRRNLEFLTEHRPRRILEVGCGGLLLAEMAKGLEFDRWTIVEPVADFADLARKATGGDARFSVVDGYLEAQSGLGPCDAVLLSGLLHETAAPEALLRAAIACLEPGGRLLASVPNAQSFHRLLAVEAGLIPAPDTLSARDVALGHPKVFDPDGLRALIAGAGLTDLTFDGYLFKPFTHAQMEAVLAQGPADAADLIDGLIRLGRKFPDQAAEICVTGVRPCV